MKKVHWAIIPIIIEDTYRPIGESVLTNKDTIPLRVIKRVDKKTNPLIAGGVSSQKTITTLSLHSMTSSSLITKASESSLYNNVIEYYYDLVDVVDKTTGFENTKRVFIANLYKIQSVLISNKSILLTLMKSNLNENNS